MRKVTISLDGNASEKKTFSVERGHIIICSGDSQKGPDGTMWIRGTNRPYEIEEQVNLKMGDKIIIRVEQTDETIFEGITAKKDFQRLLAQYRELENKLIEKGLISDGRN